MGLQDILRNQERASISPIEPSVTNKEYYVPEALNRHLEGIALTIKNIQDFGEMGDRNFLLSGPPGTGKTLGVHYLATLVGGIVYDGKIVNSADAIRDTFAQLRALAKEEKETAEQEKRIPKPLFFVINEVDKFAKREQIIDPGQQATLNALLDEMDGYDQNDNLYVFGSTNLPDSLDIALRRPGRFSKEVEFLPPDRAGRLRILEIHAYNKGHKFKVGQENLKEIAAKTFGYTGADLCGLLNESFVEALRHSRRKVSIEDLEYGFSETKPSAIRDMPYKEPSLKFSDLAGYETHKMLLKRIVEGNNGALMLFYGSPGTGKSVFAEALAGEYGYNLIFISGSELESKWVGESKDRLATVYERAKQLRPCIITFDEIDTFIETRGMVSHQKEQTGYMQSIFSKPEEGVYLIATTNSPDYLKDAMLDRFPFKLYFSLPKGQEQEAVWKKYLPADIAPAQMVQEGLSCRAIANACMKTQTYGIVTPEAVNRLLTGKQYDDSQYKALAEKIGDDVRDYRSITGSVSEEAKKVPLAKRAINIRK